MCVFLISPVPIAEPLTSELIDTPVFHNLTPRPIKYRVSVPIPMPELMLYVLNSWLIKVISLEIWTNQQIGFKSKMSGNYGFYKNIKQPNGF